MSNFEITNRTVKDLSTNDLIVREARGPKGEKYFARIMQVNRIDELGIVENLDFNRCVMGDLSQMVFPEHLLCMQQEVASKTSVAFLVKPYKFTLQQYVQNSKVNEKQALKIFDQILKAVYSIWIEDYVTRNLRSEHIVLTQNNKWCMQTLIYSSEYKQADGAESEYLWSPTHQAPECFYKSIFSDEDYPPMLVWNLGCILLEMLVSNHKFSTKEAINKIKNKPFSFKALGMHERIWKDFSPQICIALEKMLSYDPKKRVTLRELFSDAFLSPQVAKHFMKHKPAPSSKIVIGKSSVRSNKISQSNQLALAQTEKQFRERQMSIKQTLERSNLSNVIGNDDFLDGLVDLGDTSVIRNPNINGFKKVKDKEVQKEAKKETGIEPGVKPIIRSNAPPPDPKDIEELMQWQNEHIAEAVELYKCFFDQSELLIVALDVIDEMEFPQMKEKQVRELKLLIRYAVSLVSLINLNVLADGFNENRNILEIDGDLFTTFSNSPHYQAFKKFVNFKKNERANLLSELKARITQLESKPMMSSYPFISEMLKRNYKQTNFQDIKTTYRFIVKHAYDRISEDYNASKGKPRADALARTAMYVTYCLTTDKLYITEDIPDNFKFFFEWTKKLPKKYVAMNEFKNYLNSAPKEVLIKNSRYILKKYYDT